MGFEDRAGVLQDAGSIFQVILQGAGQLPGLRVCGAEGQVVILVSDAYRPVGFQPLPLLQGEVEIGAGVLQVFVAELFIVMLVFILDAVHGGVQLGQEVGAFFADGEEETGGADFPQGRCNVRISIGVEGDKSINLTFFQHAQGFLLGSVQLRQAHGDTAVFRPRQEEVFLHTALCDADFFPVQRGIVFN